LVHQDKSRVSVEGAHGISIVKVSAEVRSGEIRTYRVTRILQLSTLLFHYFENVQESVCQIAKDNILPHLSLIIVETILVNNSHLFYDCRLSTFASTCGELGKITP
jgi:hypothetical protein